MFAFHQSQRRLRNLFTSAITLLLKLPRTLWTSRTCSKMIWTSSRNQALTLKQWWMRASGLTIHRRMPLCQTKLLLRLQPLEEQLSLTINTQQELWTKDHGVLTVTNCYGVMHHVTIPDARREVTCLMLLQSTLKVVMTHSTLSLIVKWMNEWRDFTKRSWMRSIHL